MRKVRLLYSARKRLYLCISTIYLKQIDDNRVVGKISIVPDNDEFHKIPIHSSRPIRKTQKLRVWKTLPYTVIARNKRPPRLVAPSNSSLPIPVRRKE